MRHIHNSTDLELEEMYGTPESVNDLNYSNMDEALAAARAEGAAAERERIASILKCEEAVGREATAIHLSLCPEMNEITASGILAMQPLERMPFNG